MPISGPGTKIPGVKDAETPVPTAFKKVRAGDRVVLLLKGSHGGRYTGTCESQASGKMSLSGTIYFTEDQKTGGLKRSISKGELDFVTEDVLGCWVIAEAKFSKTRLMAPAPTQEQAMHGITRLIALDSARFVLRSQIQTRVCAKNGWSMRDVTARIITLAVSRMVRANEVAIGNGVVFQGSMLVFRHC